MSQPTCGACHTPLDFNGFESTPVQRRHTADRCRDVLHAQLAERTRERNAWRRIAEWRAKMMGHYRAGTHPTEKTLQEGDEARAALERLRQGDGHGR